MCGDPRSLLAWAAAALLACAACDRPCVRDSDCAPGSACHLGACLATVDEGDDAAVDPDGALEPEGDAAVDAPDDAPDAAIPDALLDAGVDAPADAQAVDAAPDAEATPPWAPSDEPLTDEVTTWRPSLPPPLQP